MKVALVHDHLNQLGGAEKVLLALIEIFPEAPIYTLMHDPRTTKNVFAGKDIRTSFIQRLPLGIGIRFFKWFLKLMPQAVETLDLSQFDLVISSSSAFCKGIITRTNTIHICYCHTPTRYLWDDTHSYVADLNFPRIFKIFIRASLSKLREWDYLASQRVDYYIANSNFVKSRIQKFYKRDSVVINPPVDDLEITPLKQEEIGDYFLVVSRLRPYKKIDLVIQAFNQLDSKYKVKIIGTGEYEYELKKMVTNDNIEFLDYKTDEEKFEYLKKCKAFIHPQEEDFGITPIESMMTGRPVIAYKSGGAIETIKEHETGEFFEQQTIEALKNAIINFDHKRYDPIKIKEYAKKFGKERFKEEIMTFVKKVTNDK
jgi:glycosyltransferase involved in cell wall biosynthesis